MYFLPVYFFFFLPRFKYNPSAPHAGKQRAWRIIFSFVSYLTNRICSCVTGEQREAPWWWYTVCITIRIRDISVPCVSLAP
jgi:hypothetical protein